MLREWLLIYFTRPLARLLIRMGAVPALRFCFHHVPALERLNDELEKDLAEWIRASILLLLITANMEVLLWHPLIPFPDLLDAHKWFGVGLRIMLAIAVVQMMPDQELFTVIHPGPRLPHLPAGSSLVTQVRLAAKPLSIGFFWQHLSRSSPVFAILAVIFTGWVGWACYGMAVLQYLFIGLVTSRDRAIDVLMVFDEQMATRRHELVRQVRILSEFARSEAALDQAELQVHNESHCGD
jgi:hypothetical protein